MWKYTFAILLLCLFSCKTTSYYIVRHAEKGPTPTMTSDVPLSEAGELRAAALKDLLKHKHIHTIYSTNFIRTKSTAQPLADVLGIPVQIYDNRDTGFVPRLKTSATGNVLIVGHSNTVDDLVNQLMGKTVIPGDLQDSLYGDVFIVRKKKGGYQLEKKHFGN